MSYLWIRVNLAVSITLVMLTAALGKSLSKERTVANSTEKLPFDSNVIFTVPLVESVMGQHRQRFRRSDSSSKYIDVTLPTPSEDIVLRLASTKSLLVPGATFEIRSNNITTATPVRNDCYFQGKVLNTNESFAALSICNGLIGVFEYEGSQYSIEPFDVDSKPGEDNYHKLHSIKNE
ncbi:ADAM28 [Bugula neritina]|uniref:ADAM28 n=1 Tax=Bugula neritina TaxID=10212 RepID=A0A7J7JHP7_BUGNE|nr:ADAM28 [Bugula neritina]